MKNLFSIGSNAGSIFVTILILISLGSFYFFIYVPDNEKELQMQRFRTLQNIEINIRSKIENTDSLLNNLLSAYSKTAERSRVNEFVYGYNSDKFTFIPFEIKYVKPVRSTNDRELIVTIDSVKQQFQFILSKTDSLGRKTEIGIIYKFSDFIEPLLPPDIFDHYIILSSGIPLYETAPSGLIYTKEDSLMKPKNGLDASVVPSRKIAGVNYRIFQLPIYYPGINKRFVIAGLLSEKRYSQERNSLPPRAIRFLLVAGFAMIIAFPWIKLFQMGNKDRLTMMDGLSAIIVAMLLMSLLFFAFSAYNLRFRPSDSPDSKVTLAKRLTQAFEEEVELAYKGLTSFDSLRKMHTPLFTNIKRGIDNLFVYYDKGRWTVLPDSLQQLLRPIRDNSSIRQLFWLDKDGSAINSWTNLPVSVPLSNLKDREYFKSIINAERRGGDLTHRSIYHLDQIMSWTRGSFTNAVSMPSSIGGDAANTVAVMTFNDKSLREAVLPPGYSYAIINRAGKVLYHSNESKKLTENIIDELSEKNELVSNMQALTAGNFNTRYFGKEYEIYFMPLTRLPYFIIVFSDVSFKETRDMEIFFFTTSMLFSFFALLVIQLVIIFISSSRKSIFKKENFDIGWMGPKTSLRRAYVLALIANSIGILLLIVFFNFSTFLEYVFILLLTITCIGIFLNGLYQKHYSARCQSALRKSKAAVVGSLVGCLVLINLGAWVLLNNPSGKFLAFEVLLVGLFTLLFFIKNIVGPKVYKELSTASMKMGPTLTFSMLGFSRLIITSGIPVLFFYIHSYNFEQNLSIRYKHILFGNQLVERYPSGEKNLNKLRGVYIDSAWINKIQLMNSKTIGVPERYSDEERHTLGILSLFRYYENDKAIGSAAFYKASAGDSTFFFNHLFKETGKKGAGTVTSIKLNGGNTYLRISSYPLNYSLPSIFVKTPTDRLKGLVFWLIVLLILFVFLLLVHIIIKRLFALGLPETNIWQLVDEQLRLNKSLNTLLFIIGSPGSGKLTKLLKRFDKQQLLHDSGNPLYYNNSDVRKNNVFIADLILIPETGDNDPNSLAVWKKVREDSLMNDYSLIVVNHFEYNIKDQTTNHQKLNYLESLMALKPTSKIMILSTIHPVAFLDSYLEEKRNEQGNPLREQDLERWHVLLGHFRIVIQPIEASRYNAAANDSRRMLIQETQYTHFLKKMRRTALKASVSFRDKLSIAEVESLALKLQITSHYFYMYIWQSLTKEEKFLLYDLAEDGLVNPFDDYNLSLLLSKGIIIRNDGTLQLFNRGFRNFILTGIGNSEVTKIRNQIKDNGNWSRLKNPLILFIIAIFTFLFTSQQETYSRLIVYVTAIGAGVPALLKIFSLFEKNTQKTG